MFICIKTCFAENTLFEIGSLRDSIPKGADPYWEPMKGAENVRLEVVFDKAKLRDKQWLTGVLKEKGIAVDHRWNVERLSALYQAMEAGGVLKVDARSAAVKSKDGAIVKRVKDKAEVKTNGNENTDLQPGFDKAGGSTNQRPDGE